MTISPRQRIESPRQRIEAAKARYQRLTDQERQDLWNEEDQKKIHPRADDGTWKRRDGGQSAVIERAGKKGRMVDARLFADSYTHGARNFQKFATANANNPNVDVVILDNTRPPIPDFDENGVRKIDKKTGKPAMKPDVVELPRVPQQMLTMDPEKLYASCLESLDKSSASDAVKKGGSGGVGIWGPPKVRSNKKSIISRIR